VRALQRGVGSLARAGVNVEAVGRDAGEGLDAAGRLHGYRQYLAQARASKASRGHDAASAAAFEREVQAQGRAALTDARALSRSALAVTRQLWSVGALDDRLAATREAAVAAGPVDAVELWERATTPAGREVLRRAGFPDGLVQTTDEILRTLAARLTVDGSRLVVTAAADGRQVTGVVVTHPRSPRAATAGDLLTRGRFEALAAAAERGEPAYLEGVALDLAAGARAEELVLHAAFGLWREGVRHARKLEDSGLATYQGGDPATAIIIIGAIGLAALIASAIVGHFCEDDDPDSTACDVEKVLFVVAFIGLSIFGAATGADDPPPSIQRLPFGSMLHHGVLTDLAEVRA
jgi:hypothetical protein